MSTRLFLFVSSNIALLVSKTIFFVYFLVYHFLNCLYTIFGNAIVNRQRNAHETARDIKVGSIDSF